MTTSTTTPQSPAATTAEGRRLFSDPGRWKRWGPYLSERQWGTVREDYSANGDCWNYLPHDHARSRAYRWGEDGLLGICDDQGLLCFSIALWNGRDPILKERLFGLTGPEGNHGEDVKEEYFYLDSTPTHSYMKALYKYPQAEFPYRRLVEENQRRGRTEPEFELADAGVFDEQRYFDVQVEYAKADADDLLIRITVSNRGPEQAELHLLPTLWFRNTWSWHAAADRPHIALQASGALRANHATLGAFELLAESTTGSPQPEPLFTENQTNNQRLFGSPNASPFVKDAFHRRVIGSEVDAVNPDHEGTKAALWYRLSVPARGEAVIQLRLRPADSGADAGTGESLDAIITQRIREADAFYEALGHADLSEPERQVARQAAAGLLWSKQFYYYDVKEWIDGDSASPSPPQNRRSGRNAEWTHLNNADVILMPDKWEYPWYAAWDLAFHAVAVAPIDPQLAKDQLLLMLREWYMHPNGQIPAYEFAFGDVNPPVHAWAAWRVYKMTGQRGARDRVFLARCFQKLLLNFTWWVNRKDPEGRNLFGGGFLGLDNIGVFDRSKPLPTGGALEQADGTAWMAFYCGAMLSMALELASEDPAYEDIATKFFEHFIGITDAINTLGGTGLWDEDHGFYYDQIRLHDRSIPLRVRSLVGLAPLLAVEVLESDVIDRLPDFKRRMDWFLANRTDLPWHSTCSCAHGGESGGHRLMAIPSRERLIRVVRYLLDESEFLSVYGIRSLSRFHLNHPYSLNIDGHEHQVKYVPGESDTGIFGGNSNWRGPIWFPLNYLLIEALERYHHFYGDSLTVEAPSGLGVSMTLAEAANELRRRLVSIFLPDQSGARPCFGGDTRATNDPHWKNLVLFHEHFHGDDGRGLGASHQTGWTALVGLMLRTPVSPRSASSETSRRSPAAAHPQPSARKKATAQGPGGENRSSGRSTAGAL